MGDKECEESSPKNSKLKFMCSYGGKILPRPSDGQLKYVGGTTRIISVPRDITFAELKKKLTEIADAELVLKFQLIPDELDDALVSVTCDEDLRHMLEEHDRRSRVSSGPVRLLRTFLFPSTPPISLSAKYPLEQRYIDAINGVGYWHWRSGSSSSSPLFTMSPSPGSSPKSMARQISFHSDPDESQVLHKVCSSPDLISVGSRQHNYLQCYHYDHQKIDIGVGKGNWAATLGGAVRCVACGRMDGFRGSGGEGDGFVPQRPITKHRYSQSPRSPLRNIW